MTDVHRPRLTWNVLSPHPFESAWSVFAKLLAVNYVHPKDIVLLIKKDEIPDDHLLNYLNSSWVDFERFGSALDVDPVRLKMCFLDQLGFIVKDEAPSNVRHCNLCLQDGFHHVFFNLAILSECPIHKIRLGPPCPACAKAVLKQGLENKKLTVEGLSDDDCDTIYRSRCKHICFDPERYTWDYWFLKKSKELEIINASRPFLNWCQRLAKTPKMKWAMTDGLSAIEVNDQNIADLSSRLAIAEQLAGPCPIPTVVDSCHRTWRTWREPTDEKISINEYFPLYRTVRKYIYLNYVRPHRNCWMQVKKLTFEDAKSLDTDSMCSVALAYAAWRMALEGFSNVEGLHRCRKIDRIDRHPYLLNGREEIHYSVTVVEWLLSSFFAIWEKIEKNAEIGHFYIERAPAMSNFYSLDNVSWSHQGIKKRWWVIFPDPMYLKTRADKRCSLRRLNGQLIVNAGLSFSVNGWAWTGSFGPYRHKDCIFRIKALPEYNYVKSYNYLMV